MEKQQCSWYLYLIKNVFEIFSEIIHFPHAAEARVIDAHFEMQQGKRLERLCPINVSKMLDVFFYLSASL